MDSTKQSPSILSLCTGLLRGLEVGIEHALQTKLRTVAYVEIETFAIDNLLQGMEKGVLGTAPIWSNLKTFPYREFHGKIFGITGGYPCQPFSVAGNRGGDKDPRHLWPYIHRIVQSTKPVFCFFENVEGHLNLGFEEVSRDLRKLGYRVEAGIYSAEEVGAPHQRKRLFILAIRDGGLEQINSFLANAESVHVQGCESRSREEQFRRSSSQLANSNCSRSGEDQQFCELRTNRIIQSPSDCRTSKSGESEERRFIYFPSRPGEQQYEWEEPRVAKSGMGITIDGYNFREDLLRGAGNGVVWQTASLAFTDLLLKFRY